MKFYYLILFLLILLGAACTRLNNNLDELRTYCGAQVPNSTTRIFKITRASEATKSTFLKTSGESIPLTVTKEGCVFLPTEKGQLNIFDPVDGTSTSLQLSDNTPQISEIKLQPLPTLHSTLTCEAPFFANEKVSLPWTFQGSGNLESIKLNIAAESADSSSQLRFKLYEKPFGVKTFDFDGILDTSLLPEGTYRLVTESFNIGTDLGLTSNSLPSNKPCELVIMHSPPLGFKNNPDLVSKPITWKVGEYVPFIKPSAGNELKVCFEKHSPAQSLQCEPKLSCKNTESYDSKLGITSGNPGIFDFYFFEQDKAGNRSSTECSTFTFSNQAPMLDFQWSQPRLNRAAAVVDLPYANLKGKININHDWVHKDKLRESLLCKVDFTIQGKDILSGEGAKCTSGRCQGMSLQDFVPCDENIAINLRDAYTQPIIHNSKMTLHIKADDGAGNSAEIKKSLWLLDDAIRIERSDLPGENTEAQAILSTKSGQLLASSGSKVFLRDKDQWRDVSPQFPPAESSESYFIKTRDDGLYLISSLMDQGKKSVHVAQYQEDTQNWKMFQTEGLCRPTIDRKKGFYCGDTTPGQGATFRYFDSQDFRETASTPAAVKECQISPYYSIDLAQSIPWANCMEGLYVLLDGNWLGPIKGFTEDGPYKYVTILADESNTIWIQTWGQWSKQKNRLYTLKNENELKEIPIPEIYRGTLGQVLFSLSSDIRPIFGIYLWDQKVSEWQLAAKSEDLIGRALENAHVSGELWYDSTSMRFTYGIHTFEISEGLAKTRIQPSDLNISKDGTIWFLNNHIPTRISSGAIIEFSKVDVGFAANSSFPWVDDEGTKLFTPDKGVALFTDGLIQQSYRAAPSAPWNILRHFYDPVHGEYLSFTGEIWHRPTHSNTFARIFNDTSGRFITASSFTVWDGSVLGNMESDVKLMDVHNPSKQTYPNSTGGTGIDSVLPYKGELYIFANNAFQRLIRSGDGASAFDQHSAPDFWDDTLTEDLKSSRLVDDKFYLTYADKIIEIDLSDGKKKEIHPPCPDFKQLLKDVYKRNIMVCEKSLYLDRKEGWEKIFSESDFHERDYDYFSDGIIDANNRLWLYGKKQNTYIWANLPD